jgi:hypothetical protein
MLEIPSAPSSKPELSVEALREVWATGEEVALVIGVSSQIDQIRIPEPVPECDREYLIGHIVVYLSM